MRNRHFPALLVLLVVVAVALSGCGTQGEGKTAEEIAGAGATFPYPLYSRMFHLYDQKTGIHVNYQGIGSGGGIRALTDKTVDFGASDAFLTEDELVAMGAPVLHIPTCVGAVVLSYNLNGKPALLMDETTVAGIFLGTITRWNDPALVALNPDITLPDLAITVIHRSDGSGTTSIFTSYLSAVSTAWKTKVGAGKSVSWPVGLGGKGNDGVAGMISQTKGSIGYIELVYATENDMPVTMLKNAAGSFITPNLASSAAAANIELPDDLRVLLIDMPAAGAYPISAFTWILVYREQHYDARTLAQAQALRDLLVWMMGEGQSVNESLTYARLPAAAVAKAMKLIGSMTYDGAPIP